MKPLQIVTLILLTPWLWHGAYASSSKTDEYYMQMAIDMAKQNPQAPFGAVIVDNVTGKILATGVNASQINPTFHGEIVAINNCAKAHPDVDWSKVTLYTTAEPCAMCQSAVVWANIPKVVYATSMDYLVSHGWDQIAIKSSEINKKAPFYQGSIVAGILADKTNPLFDKKNRATRH
ncbi:nucleoside deaminase [Legionella spiritensis]|uniref:Cytidine/deoxycytidylate deaminase n=1 Tax=Legionella spiritensis TaxID=452 RepID=A0A0W0Z9Z4_LEGSP|nr:nucleoside deaminase [Legionella spiritensis]KTD65931.1 cytidine/deoxycytidylate deaminase [Legionella spiritensis]SNV31765.1 cytidine/deoxycytidylate deaminase [Legionella spiritensis]